MKWLGRQVNMILRAALTVGGLYFLMTVAHAYIMQQRDVSVKLRVFEIRMQHSSPSMPSPEYGRPNRTQRGTIRAAFTGKVLRG